MLASLMQRMRHLYGLMQLTWKTGKLEMSRGASCADKRMTRTNTRLA